MDKSFDVHNLEAQKTSTPSSLQEKCRAAVLKETGIEKSEDLRKQLNLPALLIDFLTKQFGTNDFFINKNDVTAEDISSETYKATCVLNNQSVLLKCIPNRVMCEDNKAKVQTWRNKELCGIQKCLVSFQEGQKEIFILEGGAESLDLVIDNLRRNGKQAKESSIWCLLQKVAEILESLQVKDLRYEELKLNKIYINKNGDVFLSNPLRYVVDNSVERDPFAMSDSGSSAIYTPPEVITGEGIGQKFDVWALGAILYELAMQQPAYSITNPADIFSSLNTVVEGNKPASLSKSFSADLQATIWECLSVEVDDRPALDALISKAAEKAESAGLKNLLEQ